MTAAPRMIPDTLVTWYLAMTDRAQFVPAWADETEAISILEMREPDVAYYRFLYDGVGEVFGWRDRRLMSDKELFSAISASHIRIFVMYVNGVPGGYFELGRYPDHTQIEYFGLRPHLHGRGLGKHLLSETIAKAWEMGGDQVWVHTCNLDSESALPNYLKRGFQIIRTEEEPMPDRYRV
ncbi:MAG: GNAT family N-acetyltransferase [Anaerolineae bacterium]